jgi:hypothetical protein
MEGRRRLLTYAVLAVGWIAGLGGCASAPPTATLPIATQPAGALAWVSGGAECITPCDLEVRMDRPVLVNIHAEGYKPVRNILVLRGPNGAAALAPGSLDRLLEADPDSRVADSVL